MELRKWRCDRRLLTLVRQVYGRALVAAGASVSHGRCANGLSGPLGELAKVSKEQYHAGLAMLAECVEKCPEGMWIEGAYPRAFWRIAFHTVFFTHLYLGQNEQAFAPWPGRREGIHHGLWHQPWEVKPYELPEGAEIYGRHEILDYIRFVDELIDPTVDQLNLDSDETGFSWYKNMSKLSHQLMNLRHLQGHVG